MTLFRKNPKAFTLIELLVVISIIGMLSSVVLSTLNTTRTKARIARRTMELRQIRDAIRAAQSETGTLPTVSWVDSSAWGAVGTFVANWMPTMPNDPLGYTSNVPPGTYRWYGYSANAVFLTWWSVTGSNCAGRPVVIGYASDMAGFATYNECTNMTGLPVITFLVD
jgi:prepilin-type N-terminal cleavage/methylation domain-containing protein